MQNIKREILAVTETKQKVWFIELAYEEAMMGHAVGSVYGQEHQAPLGTVPARTLSTNDTLSALWSSPSGALWVGSANGLVATTAQVQWQTTSKLKYSSLDSNIPWTVTELPAAKATNLQPNISVVWGLDDENIFVGTYSGHIYFWNGQSWACVYEGPGQGQKTIRSFAGNNLSNIFAIGKNNTLLHFDGSRWQELKVEGEPNGEQESYTGIHIFPSGEVIISGNGKQGRLIKGSAKGLLEFVRTPLQLADLVVLNERVLLAIGDGVAELFDKEIRVIKNNFLTTTAWPGQNQVFFIEPSQTLPSFIVHDPRNQTTPWVRRKY